MNPIQTQRFSQVFDAKLIIATGARATPIIEISPPLTKTPLWKPLIFAQTFFGHPQTCVYPDVCLGIAHVSGKVPLSGQGVW